MKSNFPESVFLFRFCCHLLYIFYFLNLTSNSIWRKVFNELRNILLVMEEGRGGSYTVLKTKNQTTTITIF